MTSDNQVANSDINSTAGAAPSSAATGVTGATDGAAGSASSNGSSNVTPRDVRLLNLIFATQSIQHYQDHVPLQLMDFAHRYTRSILKDALVYNDHAKPLNTNTNLNSNSNTTVTTDDIRLAIAAAANYQFKPAPPKELMLELAHERNAKSLPAIIPKWGLNLPPEKYCLTARDWDDIYDEPEDESKRKKKKQ